MKWFEPIIAVVAIFLVILPIITSIKKIKSGKSSCGCNCSSCKDGNECPFCNAKKEKQYQNN